MLDSVLFLLPPESSEALLVPEVSKNVANVQRPSVCQFLCLLQSLRFYN